MTDASSASPAGAAPRSGEKRSYKKTLNLPKTAFPMKANLIQNEPGSRKRWEKRGVYAKLREVGAGAERGRWVFHDGPPYANGSLHLGHLLNKSMKDFVVRFRQMDGYDCPFVPGWDCHGLPIEHKVMTDLVETGKIAKIRDLPADEQRIAIRRTCKSYAEKTVKLQAEQMKRLLTIGDYGNPYLTMLPAYEAEVLEVLATLIERGLVFRALKPVHWSIANETALAEAELEYEDREDVSVYVDFEAEDASAVYAAFGLGEEDAPEHRPSFMIWTTTPWTLPANMAIAVAPRAEYALARMDGAVTVVAVDLLTRVAESAGAEDVETLAIASGEALVGLRYKHPFIEDAPASGDGAAPYRVVAADYVTMEDGCGLVHTAPGHGADDHATGLREGLPVYCPVQGDGVYDGSVPEWIRGKSIWDANDDIVARLRESGHLVHFEKFTHSYPHDWRSKTPVIFRATEQWFIGVDIGFEVGGASGSLRRRATDAVERDEISFTPGWAKNRLLGMLESRPDWCISRQRAWGLPIPAFMDKDGRTLMTAASVRAVRDVIAKHGSDAWFQREPAELLAEYEFAGDSDADQSIDMASLTKGSDILDVWFESGASWAAAVGQRSDGADFPVEVYLEGSDQHRGWFQVSLLTALGVRGKPPFRSLVTHGFMVDAQGKKLSKSAGDTIESLLDDYGADVIRWWISSLSYENDMKVGREFYNLAGENYRKVRNTLRFMLSNLGDFDAAADGVPLDAIEATSLEAWVLGEYDAMAARVLDAYRRIDFRVVHNELYHFCNTTLSAEYLAAIKDRLYCDRPDAPRRRRAQTALFALTDGLSRLIAPVLCHTGDEAYRALHRIDGADAATAQEQRMIEAFGVEADPAWAAFFDERHHALQALEHAKQHHDVDNPLDAQLDLPDFGGVVSALDPNDLADVLGVSRVTIDASLTAPGVTSLHDEPRCERSWKRDGTVRERSDGGMLSDRDAEALGLLA